MTGLGFSDKAVWSRASRRQASHQVTDEDDKDADEDEEMAFGFKIQVETSPERTAGAKITIRWVKGHDSVIFESFCGMLKRKLEG